MKVSLSVFSIDRGNKFSWFFAWQDQWPNEKVPLMTMKA